MVRFSLNDIVFVFGICVLAGCIKKCYSLFDQLLHLYYS